MIHLHHRTRINEDAADVVGMVQPPKAGGQMKSAVK